MCKLKFIGLENLVCKGVENQLKDCIQRVVIIHIQNGLRYWWCTLEVQWDPYF